MRYMAAVEFCEEVKGWLNLSEEEQKCSLSSATKAKIACTKFALDSEVFMAIFSQIYM